MYSFSAPQRAEGGLLQSDLADVFEPAFMTAHACFLSPPRLHPTDRDGAPSPAKHWSGCCSPSTSLGPSATFATNTQGQFSAQSQLQTGIKYYHLLLYAPLSAQRSVAEMLSQGLKQ